MSFFLTWESLGLATTNIWYTKLIFIERAAAKEQAKKAVEPVQAEETDNGESKKLFTELEIEQIIYYELTRRQWVDINDLPIGLICQNDRNVQTGVVMCYIYTKLYTQSHETNTFRIVKTHALG